MRILPTRLRRFLGDRSGAATVEFAIIFPAFMAMFLNSFEAGYYMVRNVMLERGTDLAIRQVRIGGANAPDFDRFKELVCEHVAGVLPDCIDNLMVNIEAVPAGTAGTNSLKAADEVCLDKAATTEAKDQASYNTGTPNTFMVVRVCALSRPFFPTTHFAVRMVEAGNGDMALVARSSYVAEPT